MASLRRAALFATLLLFCGQAVAMPMLFTDRAEFDAATGALSGVKTRVIDFDRAAAGESIPSGTSIDGVRFSYSIAGGSLEMQVTDIFDTTSGTNYLGLRDPGNFDQFLAGDEFALAFDDPVAAFGMYFISGDVLLEGDIRLRTGVGTVLNADGPETQLSDGGLVYFLGVVSPLARFSVADVLFAPEAIGTFFYNVDDILVTTVPEPGVIWLVCLGALALWSRCYCSNGGLIHERQTDGCRNGADGICPPDGRKRLRAAPVTARHTAAAGGD